MRVWAIDHKLSNEVIYCPTYEQAVETLAICLRRQERRRVDEREVLTISSEKISKREWDALEDVPDDEC